MSPLNPIATPIITAEGSTGFSAGCAGAAVHADNRIMASKSGVKNRRISGIVVSNDVSVKRSPHDLVQG
jgi:hypothetical protein